MLLREHSRKRFTSNLSFALLTAFLVILSIAGGASRADVLGQTVVRTTAWLILIIAILFSARPQWKPVAPVALLLIGAAALPALHLIPLPPSWWVKLPGRELLAGAAIVSGQDQPWRPLSISPEATINALSSLIVPATALLLIAGQKSSDRGRVMTVLLGLVAASSVIALLQFSGSRFDNPLINDVSGSVSALFANRNHFALFAAIGCLLAPAWAFQNDYRTQWKMLAAMGMVLFFVLIILASGSRAGLLLGFLGFVIGMLIVWRRIKAKLDQLQSKLALPIIFACAGALLAAIAFSVTLGRAASVDRALSFETDADLRTQFLPAVLELIGTYFPFGAGIGTFDPAYRISEPLSLLGPSYINHAHNDLVEVVLDAGLPGLLLLCAAISWWLWNSILAWKAQSGPTNKTLPKLGSAILLLVVIASVPDYPARTPIMMAIIIIAAVWLNSISDQIHRHNHADR